RVFSEVDAGADDPQDASAREAQAEAATLDTPLAEAGFSPRALSALGRLPARTVGELVRTSLMDVNGIPGLGELHRKEIQGRVRDWRARLAAPAAAQPAAASQDRSLEVFLAARVPRQTAKNHTEVAALRLVLGLPL